ncbi:hypothetical protein JHK87_015506 [Glycine soja]|nr:hypothetical protein JHK87_015506 [Glycine soja]
MVKKRALSLPINTLTNSSAKQHIYLSASSNYASLSSSLQLNPSLPTRPLTLRKSAVRVQAENEDFELKQMRDMAAARKRWEALIRDGKIKVLTPREAGYAVQLSNKPLLDVRPSNEHKKAWVRASTWIPIFDVDNKLDFGTIPRKVTSFVMGGWWSGMPTLSYDSQFLAKVEEKFPKDAELIVVCQKGLRSLAACELLYNAGYKNLFWVQGGYEAAEEEAFLPLAPPPPHLLERRKVSEKGGWTIPNHIPRLKGDLVDFLYFRLRIFQALLLQNIPLVLCLRELLEMVLPHGETMTKMAITYKIHGKMGEGTFGQVLECWDRERKEMVAIKIVRGIKKYREAAMVEIEVLQQLGKHDKVVCKYGTGLTIVIISVL